jgi:hypothetical protein
MNAKTIIRDYLVQHNYAGLADATNGCGCDLNDLAPCDAGIVLQCRPARKRILDQDEYLGDCGPGDVAYSVAA